jgi:hypothetical protein
VEEKIESCEKIPSNVVHRSKSCPGAPNFYTDKKFKQARNSHIDKKFAVNSRIQQLTTKPHFPLEITNLQQNCPKIGAIGTNTNYMSIKIDNSRLYVGLSRQLENRHKLGTNQIADWRFLTPAK